MSQLRGKCFEGVASFWSSKLGFGFLLCVQDDKAAADLYACPPEVHNNL